MGDWLLFLGLSGSLIFPHSGGGDLTVGTYVSELTAIEARVGMYENSLHAGADALFHWSSWSLYDRFFGYSAFDPFLSLGVDVYNGRARQDVGPSLGAGAFYHLTESLDLRADAKATLGLEGEEDVFFSAGLGLQWNF